MLLCELLCQEVIDGKSREGRTAIPSASSATQVVIVMRADTGYNALALTHSLPSDPRLPFEKKIWT